MTAKQDLPAGPPPPLYSQHDTASTIGSPAPAHMHPQHTPQSDYYGASPAMGHAQPYGGYPPHQGGYGGGYGAPQEGYPPQGYPPQGYPPNNGYYGQNPQMGYQQQQQYGPPQGMYYGGQPQGQYVERRRGPGFCEAVLASLACCCCLDLLF
ncbi:hypothetical protein PVAG01_07625 [Phlyctema vagabunda]|uniref:Cysteine-rich transmembrane CYSTM domain-containing protein n=1 Tax=Phlyctema vagabunda TaxID=108571 RepID=A0ABR4PCZ3_9HELO